MTRVQILWRSGGVTEAGAERPRHVGPTPAPNAVVAEIRAHVADGWSDRTIAQDFNRTRLRQLEVAFVPVGGIEYGAHRLHRTW